MTTMLKCTPDPSAFTGGNRRPYSCRALMSEGVELVWVARDHEATDGRDTYLGRAGTAAAKQKCPYCHSGIMIPVRRDT